MRVFEGACHCGDVAFEADHAPLFRALCHCSICRAYHNRDWADFSVFRTKGFTQRPGGHVTYKVHKNPPLLKRGRCDSCNAPVLEKLFIPGLPRLMLIPSRWIAQQDALPDPAFHMFYDLRLNDAVDGLPKDNGYLPSQIRFSAHLMRSLLRRSA